MTNQLTTREQYIKKNTKAWMKRGAAFKERRTRMCIPRSIVAGSIGISESTLRRFELGYPVTRSELVARGYEMFLELRLQVVKDIEIETSKARFLIDQDADEAGKVTITMREYKKVAEIDTGDAGLNEELAVAFCERNGGSYGYAI